MEEVTSPLPMKLFLPLAVGVLVAQRPYASSGPGMTPSSVRRREGCLEKIMSEKESTSLEYLQATGGRMGVESVICTITTVVQPIEEEEPVTLPINVEVQMKRGHYDFTSNIDAWKKAYGKAMMKIINDD